MMEHVSEQRESRVVRRLVCEPQSIAMDQVSTLRTSHNVRAPRRAPCGRCKGNRFFNPPERRP